MNSEENTRVGKQPIVHLDVGGKLFKVLKTTLLHYPDSLLAKMLEEFPNLGSAEEPLFVDRSPQAFSWILEIYRSGDYKRCAPDMSEGFLQAELDFYQMKIPPEELAMIENRAGRHPRELAPRAFSQTPPFTEIIEAIKSTALWRHLPVDVCYYYGVSEQKIFSPPKFCVRPSVGCDVSYQVYQQNWASCIESWRKFTNDNGSYDRTWIESFTEAEVIQLNEEAREFGLAVSSAVELGPSIFPTKDVCYLIISRL